MKRVFLFASFLALIGIGIYRYCFQVQAQQKKMAQERMGAFEDKAKKEDVDPTKEDCDGHFFAHVKPPGYGDLESIDAIFGEVFHPSMAKMYTLRQDGEKVQLWFQDKLFFEKYLPGSQHCQELGK